MGIKRPRRMPCVQKSLESVFQSASRGHAGEPVIRGPTVVNLRTTFVFLEMGAAAMGTITLQQGQEKF